MTSPSAWRPLSEAPRIYAIRHIVRAKGHETVAEYNYLGWRMDSGKYIDETQWEYRAEVELDRAVQVKIAEAFGALLSRLLAASQQEHLASFAPPKQTWVKKRLLREANESRRRGLHAFCRILHTSMGGRIPDEVPHG